MAAQQATTAGANVVVPPLVKYNGMLASQDSKRSDGIVGVTFSLYRDSEGGAPLWMETQNVRPDTAGHYTVMLGSASKDGVPASLFASGEARWLGVQAQGQVEQPRVLLMSVPYALKAADAETIGGLPASAFVLAVPPKGDAAVPANESAAPSPASVAPPVSSNVTTTGGTASTIPMFTTATNIQNSILTQTGTSAINVRGKLNLPSTGTATATGGKNSRPLAFVASVFNSTTSTPVPQIFQWQSEAINNNTANASGTLNLLYASGTAAPAETGLRINNKGQILFVPGQAFPGTGTVTSVGTGLGLTGGPVTTTGTLKIDTNVVPQLAASNTFTGNQTVKGNLLVSAGKVGIGTTTPNAQLESVVASEGTLALRLDSGPNSFLDITPSNLSGRFQTQLSTANNRDLTLLPGAGNVAIGETVPQFGKLQIFQGNSTAALTVDGSSFPFNNYHLDLVAFAPASGVVDYTFVVKREDENLASNVLTLTQPTGLSTFCNGCVGIGTTSPANKLDVVGGHISVGGSRTLSCTRSCGAIGSIGSGGTSTYSTGSVPTPSGYSLTGCSAYWASNATCSTIQYPAAGNITALDDGAGACHALGVNGSGGALESCACVTACQLP